MAQACRVLRFCLGTLLVLLAVAMPAQAANRALLIGVSGYAGSLRLEGPPNDVRLMRERLLSRDFSDANIRILADGVSAEVPTRAAIMGALTELERSTGRGDFVYVHFSGHGTQQPEVPNYPRPKPDGLSQVILPLDVGGWNAERRQIENAITDHEFGEALNRIRAKGAFVFALVDSCHSGTMTRAAGIDTGDRERLIRPSDLDPANAAAIERAIEDARSSNRHRGAAAGGDGWELAEGSGVGSVGFFATQTDEPEIETKLPEGESTYYGLFTYAFAQALAEQTGPTTYRQSAQRIAQIYTEMGRRRPMPLFVGDLDAPLFGGAGAAQARQWRIVPRGNDVEIEAGKLHGLNEGAVLAVLRDPRHKDEDAIGHLRVTRGDLARARAEPVAPAPARPAIELNDIPAHAYARLVQAPVDLSLGVARPPAVGSPSPKDRKLLEAVRMLEASPETVPGLRWVGPTDAAESRLYITDGRLYFLPSSGEITTERDAAVARRAGRSVAPTFSVAADEDDLGDRIAEVLKQIGRVHTVMRVAGAMDNAIATGAVHVGLTVAEPDGARAATCGTKHKQARPITASELPRLRHCDRVNLRLENRSSGPVDVTVLYVDSAYGIHPLFPADPRDSNRLMKKDSWAEVPLDVVTLDEKGAPTTTGREHVLIFAVPLDPKSMERVDFSFLAQPSLIGERTRGAESPATVLMDLLEESKKGTRAVRLQSQSPLKAASLRLLTWDVVPEGGPVGP